MTTHEEKRMFASNVENFLRHIAIPLRLACTTESGWPFVLSLWFLYEDGRFYCATQASARVVKYLRDDPRVAFEVAGDLPPYCGVRGQARAEFDAARGAEILERLLKHYLGGTDSPLARKLLAQRDREVAICLTPVNHFTWNFTARMQDSVGDSPEKICP